MKKILLIIALLLCINIVSAGVTNPLPPELSLEKSEEGRFKFQIQNLNRPYAIECTYELEGTSDLVVEFDDEIITIDANAKKDFYGSVTAPGSLGQFSQSFCVKCEPVEKEAGASVSIDSCGLPVNVNVVEQKTKENMTIPEKPVNMVLIGLVLLGIVLFVLVVGLFKKKPVKKAATKKKAKKKKRK